MCKGERPIGAAKGKQTSTMALCHPPPLLQASLGTYKESHRPPIRSARMQLPHRASRRVSASSFPRHAGKMQLASDAVTTQLL